MAAKNKKSKKKNNLSLVFAALLSIVLVAIIVFGIFVLINDPDMPNHDQNGKDETTTDVKKELKNNTDEDVKTEEDKPTDNETTYTDEKAGYEAGKNGNEVEKDASGKKIAAVSLNIVQANDYIILSGRVTNFKEEGGSCIYKLQQGTGEPRQYTSQIIPDAKNTVCEAVKLDKKDVGSGEWKVWMEYKSNSAEGASEAQAINL